MAFIDQVQDLTSLTVSDNDELSQFLKDGVIDVTNRWLLVRPQDISIFSRESAETTSNGSLDINGAQIISVIRENGTNNQWRACRQIFPAEQYDVTDTESLSYASKYNPAFMIGDNGQISVFPTPSSTTDAFKVYHVNNVPVDKSGTALIHSHSDIGYFADDKVYLVIMYAGIKLIHATLAAKSAPSVPVSQVLPTLNITATDPTAISLTTVNYNPVIASASTVLTSLTAPTYTKPTMVLGAAPTITDLSVTVVPPDAPSNPSISSPGVATVTIGSLGTEPTLTSTTLTTRVALSGYTSGLSETDPGVFSVTAVPPDVPAQTTSLPTYEEADASISDGSIEAEISKLQDYIEDEEDVELATAKVAEINTRFQRASEEFNNKIKQWQTENSGESQRYQAEVQEYQADVGAQVQEYTQKLQHYSTELNTAYQAWAKTESDSLQQYQLDIQANLNEFNEDNAIYQSTVQEAIQNATIAAQEAQKEGDLTLQAAIQDYTLELQKYQAEYAGYTAEVGAQVQEYQQNLAGDIQVWQAERSTDLQKYGSDIQNELNEFNKENASFGYEVKKALADAQSTNQVALQNGSQEARDAIENNNAQVQRFQSMAQHYATQVNEDVQKYTVQVQALTADIQASVAEHGAELQGTQAEYQWLQDQYTRLKAEYDQAFMIAAPKQQAAPQAARQRR